MGSTSVSGTVISRRETEAAFIRIAATPVSIIPHHAVMPRKRTVASGASRVEQPSNKARIFSGFFSPGASSTPDDIDTNKTAGRGDRVFHVLWSQPTRQAESARRRFRGRSRSNRPLPCAAVVARSFVSTGNRVRRPCGRDHCIDLPHRLHDGTREHRNEVRVSSPIQLHGSQTATSAAAFTSSAAAVTAKTPNRRHKWRQRAERSRPRAGSM